MNILHIEDYDEEKGVDYAILLKNAVVGHNYANVQTLSELENENIRRYDIFVIDGQFPKDSKSRPEVKMCRMAVELLKSCGVKTEQMIVWSNSTRAHQFAAENHMSYFSKKEMKAEDYPIKGVDPKYMAKKADPVSIAKLIMEKNRK